MIGYLQCLGDCAAPIPTTFRTAPDEGEGLLLEVTVMATFKNLIIQEAGRIKTKVIRGDDEVRLGNLVVSLQPQKETTN